MTPLPARPRSLRWRLLVATLVVQAVALLLSGAVLAELFREEAMRQFQATLAAQLDQLTARFEVDAQGRPQIDAARLSDPRWSRPYSGLYWQIDAVGDRGLERGVLRSRSLWDTALDPGKGRSGDRATLAGGNVLQAPGDAIADGALHVHAMAGPGGARLLAVERTVRPAAAASAGGGAWRLLVAADLGEADAATRRFGRVLAVSLLVLFVLLAAAAVAQVAVGLAPLRALQRGLAALRGGESQRLDGIYPAELQPLVQDFNAVLDRNAEVVARARTQAGNLAHALKTPLAVLAHQAEAAASDGTAAQALAPLVREQVALARRHVDWHLARSRAAAAQGVPGMRTPVDAVLRGLLRVLGQLHAGRPVTITLGEVPPGAVFAGEREDLQEMLGNLLDNACQWARSWVRVSVTRDAAAGRLAIRVEDDGPGIEPGRRADVLARGGRLDESAPGSGLGLAIVQELAGLYGGALVLDRAGPAGLRAVLELPGDDAPAAPREPGAGPA